MEYYRLLLVDYGNYRLNKPVKQLFHSIILYLKFRKRSCLHAKVLIRY